MAEKEMPEYPLLPKEPLAPSVARIIAGEAIRRAEVVTKDAAESEQAIRVVAAALAQANARAERFERALREIADQTGDRMTERIARHVLDREALGEKP